MPSQKHHFEGQKKRTPKSPFFFFQKQIILQLQTKLFLL